MHLNLPQTRLSYHQDSLTISNQITESKDVFRPAASTFILMPWGRRSSSHPFTPDLPSFGQTLDITQILGLHYKNLRKVTVSLFFTLSQRLSFYVRITERQEKGKKKANLLNDQVKT